MTAKRLRFDEAARRELRHGVDVLANSVRATLGRKGRGRGRGWQGRAQAGRGLPHQDPAALHQGL